MNTSLEQNVHRVFMRYLSALVLLVLSACTATGSKVDQKVLSTFVNGKTTYSDVIQHIGEPSQSTIRDDGTSTADYNYKQSMDKAANFLPLASMFIAMGAGEENITVIMKFDNKSLLSGYTIYEMDEEAGTGKILKKQ